MNRRRLVVLVGVLAICGAACYPFATAAPAAKEGAADSLAVRTARAQLRLAELTMQKVQEMNKKVAGTLSASMTAQIVDDVEFAKAQLENALQPGGGDPFQAWLRRAELAVRSAEFKLKKVKEADRRAPGSYVALDIERLRLGVEIAQLKLERGKSLASASPEAKLQWQLEMLDDGVARLRNQTSMALQNRMSEF
jgi:hypothetical protein